MSQGLDDALGVVLAVAQALREEFGVGIDAHPGGVDTEAGAVNRSFLATIEVILSICGTTDCDLTDVLRQTALRRLKGHGLPADQAEVLVSNEPRLGHRWLAYLTLAPASVIEDLMIGER